MTLARLREAHKAAPFKPFTFSLADGRQFNVPHTEFLWMPRTASRTFWVSSDGEGASLIDLMLVVSLDFGNASINGQRPRRRKS